MEANPLGFVDRLLDEERDTNLHLGDVRFWEHIEYMDTRQIYRTKSLEFRTLKLMCCETLFYIAFFLMVSTGYVLNIRTSNLYEARQKALDFWGDCKRGPDGTRGTGSCALEDVSNSTEVYMWLKNDFVDKLFVDREVYYSLADSTSVFMLSAGTMNWAPRYVGDTRTSVLIGSARVRQLRVQFESEECAKEEFSDIESECIPDFSEPYQSRKSWAPVWTPEHMKPYFEWSAANETQQTEMQGNVAKYPGDGFTFDFNSSQNREQARLLVDELENWYYLDKRTRALIIEVSTLTPNVNIFVHNRILFEFTPLGRLFKRHEAFAFRSFQLSFNLFHKDNQLGFVCLIFTIAAHLFLFAYSCYLLRQNGKLYFTYFWSYFDLMIFLFFSIYVGTLSTVVQEAATLPNLAPELLADPDMFYPIGQLVSKMEYAENILAAHSLLIWLKILKYFTLLSTVQAFVKMIERCIKSLVLFVGLLCVVMFGFAMAFYLGYGAEDNLFSTLTGAMYACAVAPTGAVAWTAIFAYEDYLGPILVFSYLIIIFLLLLNTFMAICVDIYSVCSYEVDEVKRTNPVSPLQVFLITYWHTFWNRRLVGRESEADKGLPDEQTIPITSLPEAVVTRWKETKERMELIYKEAMDKIHAEEEGAGQLLGRKDSLKLALKDVPKKNSLNDVETVSRVQLQRMMDDDPILEEILSKDDGDEDMQGRRNDVKAIDVVRRFRVDQSSADPYEAVAQLQKEVTAQLENMKGSHVSADELDTLKTVSQELHSSLTESQKEWRSELLSVLQMTSLLSTELIELTTRMEEVQLNHNALAVQAQTTE